MRERIESLNKHPALIVWLTGLSGSGKSTIANALNDTMFRAGISTAMLDGDVVRAGLCNDLGFTPEDRAENIRRVADVAAILYNLGHVVICSFISPYAEGRGYARGLVPPERFVEIHVRCGIEECERRDPKGLYRKARAGELQQFTGVDAPYERPNNSELVIDTETTSTADSVDAAYQYVMAIVSEWREATG